MATRPAIIQLTLGDDKATLLTDDGPTEHTAPELRQLAADCIQAAQAMELWVLDGPVLAERLDSTIMASVADHG